MELLPSLAGASDDSSCDVSTGPATPDSSPLFGPSLTDDLVEKRLSHFLRNSRARSTRQDRECSQSLAGSDRRQSLPLSAIRNACFIGAGYVGGPTAAVVALHNPSINVEVLDRDQNRIRDWTSSHLPIHEPGLDEVVRMARDGARRVQESDHDAISLEEMGTKDSESDRLPNLSFTTDSKSSISKADIVFLAVNTPTKTFGVGSGRATNMTALDGAVKDIATYARPETIIVEKSTVPCGTAQRIRRTLHALRPGVPFEVLSNPEFLAEGTAVQDLMSPERVVIGCAETSAGRSAARALAGLYAAWVPPSRIVEINAWSSELCKLVANAMLAQRISSMNSISAICEATGADVNEIAKSIGLDPRIGPKFLKAGLGFGGSCFRKDIASLTYLAESLGLPEVADYWSQVNFMNELQRQRFTRRVVQRLSENLLRKKITLLGFAFKKNTGDTRESLAVDVVRLLLEERPAEIAIFDPYCREEDIRRELDPVCVPYPGAKDGVCPVKVYRNAYEACAETDAVLIITDCDQFKNVLPSHSQARLAKHQDSDTPSTQFLRVHDQSYQLLSPPTCQHDCLSCQQQKASGPRPTEPLDWPRIVSNMKEPRRVFDGRGVLDIAEMEKLGVRVDAIGRRSTEDMFGSGLY